MKLRNALTSALRLRLAVAVFAAVGVTLALGSVVGATRNAPIPGVVLRSFVPAHVGDGRSVAFDPGTGHLFYTNTGDNHIYVVDTNNNPVTVVSPMLGGNPVGFTYSALAWNSKGLTGARYDGSGQFDLINVSSGVVSPLFKFSFPVGDSCYDQGPGFPDGLAYDDVNKPLGSLWISDDAARHIFHIMATGVVIKEFAVYRNKCNTGITANGSRLWLGMQGGADTPPFEILGVRKSNPTSQLFAQFLTGGALVEGLAFDGVTFAPNCAVWTNQAGSTVLTAWQVTCSAR